MEKAASISPAGTRPIPQAPILLSVAATSAALGPAFPVATLRDKIYHSEPRRAANGELTPANGFADCIIRIPGSGGVLLDYERVLAWIESGRGRRARSRSEVAA
jgi:hypothetical protein